MPFYTWAIISSPFLNPWISRSLFRVNFSCLMKHFKTISNFLLVLFSSPLVYWLYSQVLLFTGFILKSFSLLALYSSPLDTGFILKSFRLLFLFSSPLSNGFMLKSFCLLALFSSPLVYWLYSQVLWITGFILKSLS